MLPRVIVNAPMCLAKAGCGCPISLPLRAWATRDGARQDGHRPRLATGPFKSQMLRRDDLSRLAEIAPELDRVQRWLPHLGQFQAMSGDVDQSWTTGKYALIFASLRAIRSDSSAAALTTTRCTAALAIYQWLCWSVGAVACAPWRAGEAQSRACNSARSRARFRRKLTHSVYSTSCVARVAILGCGRGAL